MQLLCKYGINARNVSGEQLSNRQGFPKLYFAPSRIRRNSSRLKRGIQIVNQFPLLVWQKVLNRTSRPFLSEISTRGCLEARGTSLSKAKHQTPVIRSDRQHAWKLLLGQDVRLNNRYRTIGAIGRFAHMKKARYGLSLAGSQRVVLAREVRAGLRKIGRAQCGGRLYRTSCMQLHRHTVSVRLLGNSDWNRTGYVRVIGRES